MVDLLSIYWYVLVGSFVIAILLFFLGDIFDGILDGFFHPLLIFGTLAVISGTGIILTTYTSLSVSLVLIIGLILGSVTYISLYYFLIIPLSRAESSNAHSIRDYEGRMAEVITTIPEHGYGEVYIPSAIGSQNETAKSFDGIKILSGQRVVIVQVDEEGVLHVSPMEDLLDS
ncbi:membrane protein implicated in regulation of membrane protease activity [Pullulanibacillus pueri]|uniref:Membrane protein NfeD2 N-terminal transmembrane domain-containing protein n=1 Tax=Pullulanibacillus pueri TaxID=1437324 RepID=A0A8J2ZRE7_9BACL|nr:hypothetical protein [Pullulanibacillus pueri]MBM7679961.1 membrane protein implicated in regulation of membrane protease activity [Pullulanibacillus pueri]GGH73678.1 hypothetical protein GCM10007096_01150 [Pullulanibacillus pueri]